MSNLDLAVHTALQAPQKYNLTTRALNSQLHLLINEEEIVRLLGLTAEQDADFWTQQHNTVVHRFYSYLLFKAGLNLTTDRAGLSLADAELLHNLAKAYLEEGLTYEIVRTWWLTQGKFIHENAYAAKREQERLAASGLAVLVFFEGGRPLWLAFGPQDAPRLVEERAHAALFPVHSVLELTKEALHAAADRFYVLCQMLGATHVKVLPVVSELAAVAADSSRAPVIA